MPVATREGKSGVNVKRLVQNIADQYPFNPQQAALIEIVANSLDAKAAVIEIDFDGKNGILKVTDDGIGMNKRQFLEYHDFAASTKERGSGIGFADQGAKLALNFCTRVITETRSSSYRGYSEWQIKGNDAPYTIHDGETLSLNHAGTRITLYLDRKSKAFYSKKFIEQILKEQYFPLLDERLLNLYVGESPILVDDGGALLTYQPVYERGLKFIINGEQIALQPVQNKLDNQKRMAVTVRNRTKAMGFFGLAKGELEESLQGIAICTFGKVIERTWFKKEPLDKHKITGWIEAPYLIEAVTTDKCRFQKGNKTWEGFFRKAQSEFGRWLEETGLSEKPSEKRAGFSNIEREINQILRNIPELTFFGARSKKDVAIPDKDGEPREMGEGTQMVKGTEGGEGEGQGISAFPGDDSGEAPTLDLGEGVSATPYQRTIRGGIGFAYEARTELTKEARFDGETVYVNLAHPAYKRAEREKVLIYHIIKSVALSLVEFTLEKDTEPSYQKAFDLAQTFFRLWGER
jgi:hypothetical protein